MDIPIIIKLPRGFLKSERRAVRPAGFRFGKIGIENPIGDLSDRNREVGLERIKEIGNLKLLCNESIVESFSIKLQRDKHVVILAKHELFGRLYVVLFNLSLPTAPRYPKTK